MRDDRPTPRVVEVRTWRWGPEAEQRPGIPWLGLFLVVFGVLLLLERLVPGGEIAGSLVFLAVGLAFVVRWVLDRRSIGSLYAGAIITALAAPDLIEGLRIAGGPGLGQLCLGVAFLAIAAVRRGTGGGIGWQAWLGVILAVLGAAQLLAPGAGSLVLPALLVAIGVVLVLRSRS